MSGSSWKAVNANCPVSGVRFSVSVGVGVSQVSGVGGQVSVSGFGINIAR